ncbi:CoA pyrophosphatase [bacterium]|nr:CoA pyrophosphatase [bacterium]
MYAAFAHYQSRRFSDPSRTESAVLVPVCLDPEGDFLLYGVRSEHYGTHRGQVCFPGGKRSPEDVDLIATALREAHEEIGLDPGAVEVLGVLDDVITPSGFTITPVVGRIAMPYPFSANPDELSRLIRVPIASLLDPARIPLVPDPDAPAWVRDAFDADGARVWGATARITRQFVDRLREGMAPPSPDGPTGR